MSKVIILGGSGIGIIASSILERNGHEVLGFLNDVLDKGSYVGKYRQIEVIGSTSNLQDYLIYNDIYFFIAYVGLQKEKQTYEKIKSLKIPNEKLISVIDNSAIIPDGYCKIGNGVMISPLCQLSPDTTISDNCILLANSFVGHDSFLDRFAHIATNAVVGANVHVGKGVHIGSNATIREKIIIGDFSLIGAGSVVLKDVPENSIVVGNPAKILKFKG